MADDLSDQEIQALYACSGVTRSLKRRRFSPTAGGGDDLLPQDAPGDRRVTRKFASRLHLAHPTVSFQPEGLVTMGDQTSPGVYRQPRWDLILTDESEEDAGSIPRLTSSDAESHSSDGSKFEELVKPMEIADVGDTTSTATGSSGVESEGTGDSGDNDDGGEGGEDGDDTIKNVQACNNNLDGKLC